MNRPVRCAKCQEPMFYANDPRHEAEIQADLSMYKIEKGDKTGRLKEHQTLYFHSRCFDLKPSYDPSLLKTTAQEVQEEKTAKVLQYLF